MRGNYETYNKAFIKRTSAWYLSWMLEIIVPVSDFVSYFSFLGGRVLTNSKPSFRLEECSVWAEQEVPNILWGWFLPLRACGFPAHHSLPGLGHVFRLGLAVYIMKVFDSEARF